MAVTVGQPLVRDQMWLRWARQCVLSSGPSPETAHATGAMLDATGGQPPVGSTGGWFMMAALLSMATGNPP
jgi:hypothetical protein